MELADTLRRDRTRVERLFRLFDETDDMATRARLMDETLATIEAHRGSASEIAYIVHGVGAPLWRWPHVGRALSGAIRARLPAARAPELRLPRVLTSGAASLPPGANRP